MVARGQAVGKGVSDYYQNPAGGWSSLKLTILLAEDDMPRKQKHSTERD